MKNTYQSTCTDSNGVQKLSLTIRRLHSTSSIQLYIAVAFIPSTNSRN